MKTSFAVIVGISLIVSSFEISANADSADYKIMPNPPNVPFLGTAAINNRGDVLGIYGLDKPYTSSMFIYSNNSFTFLPLPPGVDNVYGTGINSSGQVTGYFYTQIIKDGLMVNTTVTPFLYSNGNFTTLPQYPGATHTWPTAINDLGQIVGKWVFAPDGWVISNGYFLYSNGVYTSVPFYPGTSSMELTGINNLGQIVGATPPLPQDNGFWVSYAFIYQNGVFNVIDCLSGNNSIKLFNINDQGEVLGTLSSLPYIYKNGKCTMLPNYPGWNRAVWYAGINNKDQIIGTVNDYASNTLQWFIYGSGPNPSKVTLKLGLSRSQVYPDNTSGDSETIVTATLTSSDPSVSVSGKTIQFATVSKELSGGHSHSGGRPTGNFDYASCVTSPSGICSRTYTASELGGIETLSGVLVGDSSVSDSKDLIVAVPGLFEVAGGNPLYRLTGQTAAHPSNHFISSSASGIFSLVSDFYDEFNATLGLNDMSLSSGGLFDIGPTSQYPKAQYWTKPHSLHREGLSVDIDKCALSTIDDNENEQGSCPSGWIQVPKYRIEELCNSAGGHIEVEGPIHCEFEE